MPSETRARRLANRIREELAELLQREVDDPRLKGVIVTDVEVDRELAYATIYVSVMGAEVQRDEILHALEGSRGFLRSQLAARIEIRSFPQLRFRWDLTPDRGARVDELLRYLRDEGGTSEEDG
ncbi:MAG TPA: 30S ribosome-binding factor RbfA [Anaerolineae bacterium]|nr:30S ribosome-binding factor RbfA [Anaerolineae bacterium]